MRARRRRYARAEYRPSASVSRPIAGRLGSRRKAGATGVEGTRVVGRGDRPGTRQAPGRTAKEERASYVKRLPGGGGGSDAGKLSSDASSTSSQSSGGSGIASG